MPIQETGEKDLYQLQAKDCGYNEGTICLVNGGVVPRGWFSSMGARTAPLNSQWLVHKIGGADFLHCWVTDSIWLERSGLLKKLSDSFNGDLFRALTKFTVVLPVNNSLVRRVRPASSWPRDSLP